MKHEVRYVGVGDRVISKSDWRSIGVEAEGARWTRTGPEDAVVTVEDMPEGMMNYLTKTDAGDFKVTAVEEPVATKGKGA